MQVPELVFSHRNKKVMAKLSIILLNGTFAKNWRRDSTFTRL
tara:strand:- start:3523 stop:3648 length:126 start_codon:yes stop_codon:yes gene_type:complete